MTAYRKVIVALVIGIVVGALGVVGVSPLLTRSTQEQVVVFAGAAGAPVYDEAARLFESKYGIKVEFRLGGSGSVLSAMTIAKTGDVFIPGSPEYLLQANAMWVVNISAGHVKKLAYLVPAIIVQKGNPKNVTSLEDLAKPGLRVGIGDPKSVCVGLYAKEILEKSGLWEAVSKNIVVYAQSCDATAALIPTKAVDAIMGWHVFKDWTPDKADIVWIAPSKILKIGYIAGAVSTFTKDKLAAERFLDFLASSDMAKIWAKYGYYATEQEAKLHAPNAEIEPLG